MSNYFVGDMPCNSDFLAHHGIKGQKWGIRRYQNPDGTLTAAGRARYRTAEELGYSPIISKQPRLLSRINRKYSGTPIQRDIARLTNKYLTKSEKANEKSDKIMEKANHNLSEKDNRKITKYLEKSLKYGEFANFGKELQKTYADMDLSERRKTDAAYVIGNAAMTYAPFIGGLPLALGGALVNGFVGSGKVSTRTYERVVNSGEWDEKHARRALSKYM